MAIPNGALNLVLPVTYPFSYKTGHHTINRTFSLFFLVKKAKAIANGEAPIYLRITIDGNKTELSTNRNIQPSKWNNVAQK